MKVGMIVAMESELRLIAKSLTDFSHKRVNDFLTVCSGKFGKVDVVLCLSGIGKVNAAMSAMVLIFSEQPDFIVNTGVAGSLDEKVKPTDIVIGNRVKYCDVWCGKPNAKGQVQDLPEWFPTMEVKTDSYTLGKLTKKYHTKKDIFCIHCAPLVSGDQFMETVADKIKCNRASGHAKAVDMESGAIAQVCYRLNVPFLPIRIISDVVGSAHHQQKYENFWQEMAERSFTVTMQLIKEICQNWKKE